MNQELNQDQIEFITKLCANYNFDAEQLLNTLNKAQEHFGYLSLEIQNCIAKTLNIQETKIYETVKAYSIFTTTPKGEFPIRVCMGRACRSAGAGEIFEIFTKKLNIKEGETTGDGKFSLKILRCVGACGSAPIVIIGEKSYGKFTPSDVENIIKEYNG